MNNSDSLDEILYKSASDLARDPPTQIPFWLSFLHPFKLLAASRRLDNSAAFQRHSDRQHPFLISLLLCSTSSFVFAWPFCYIVAAFLPSGNFYMLDIISLAGVSGAGYGYYRAIKHECQKVNSKLGQRINEIAYRKFTGG